LRYTDPDGHCVWDICIGEAILFAAVTVTATYYLNKAVNETRELFNDRRSHGHRTSDASQESKPETKTSDSSTSQDKTETKVNTNPYAGPVGKPVTVVDPKGNAIPVGEGQQIKASPKGDYQQVLDKNGKPTGDRLDAGGHKKQTNPRAQKPHSHRPNVTNEDGDPHLPINE
jgi:hypothetical protein